MVVKNHIHWDEICDIDLKLKPKSNTGNKEHALVNGDNKKLQITRKNEIQEESYCVDCCLVYERQIACL